MAPRTTRTGSTSTRSRTTRPTRPGSTSAATRTDAAVGSTATSPPDDLNLAVVRGRLTSPPRRRTLPSGDELFQLELTTGLAAGAVSVPVVRICAPGDRTIATISQWGAGLELLVVGTVRRRFFHSGGATRSATEVVADRIVPTRQRRRAERVLHAVASALRPVG